MTKTYHPRGPTLMQRFRASVRQKIATFTTRERTAIIRNVFGRKRKRCKCND